MSNIKIIEDKRVRVKWDKKKEYLCFSVLNILNILTDNSNYQPAKNYLKALKNKLNKGRSELVAICNQLKFVQQVM